MHINYDPEVDGIYIRFTEITVTTKHLAEATAADYDAQGKLAGIEILDAVKRFGNKDTLRKVTPEEIGLSRGTTAFICTKCGSPMRPMKKEDV